MTSRLETRVRELEHKAALRYDPRCWPVVVYRDRADLARKLEKFKSCAGTGIVVCLPSNGREIKY